MNAPEREVLEEGWLRDNDMSAEDLAGLRIDALALELENRPELSVAPLV